MELWTKILIRKWTGKLPLNSVVWLSGDILLHVRCAWLKLMSFWKVLLQWKNVDWELCRNSEAKCVEFWIGMSRFVYILIFSCHFLSASVPIDENFYYLSLSESSTGKKLMTENLKEEVKPKFLEKYDFECRDLSELKAFVAVFVHQAFDERNKIDWIVLLELRAPGWTLVAKIQPVILNFYEFANRDL